MSQQEKKNAGGADEVPLPKKDYNELLAKAKELEELREKLLRSAADFDNAKKRLMRERDDFVKFSQENLIRSLVPILDNFERALAHVPASQDPGMKGVISGIQILLKQFRETLKQQGLKRVASVGEKFDPHVHEAVGHVEQEGEPDRVVEEIEAGYFLHDRLLRAAKVRVSAPEKQEEIT